MIKLVLLSHPAGFVRGDSGEFQDFLFQVQRQVKKLRDPLIGPAFPVSNGFKQPPMVIQQSP